MVNFRVKKLLAMLPGIFGLMLLSGCFGPRKELDSFNNYFSAGNYNESAVFARDQISNKDTPKKNDLLWTLQAAAAERYRADYSASSLLFDRCEDMMKYYDTKENLSDTATSVAVNETAVPYKGQEHDGVMVNTYKALNFMAQGNRDLARVEFNRALERQKRSREHFNKQIQKTKENLEKNSKDKDMAKKSAESPEMKSLIENNYPNLYNFEAYPDFVNPFTTYMSGVFFTVDGDYNKAVDMFKETYGMVGSNKYAGDDLVAIEKALNGAGAINDTVWVIFENGLGPVREESRIDLPLFVVTDKVQYFGIALPKLRLRNAAHPYLSIEAGDEVYQTQVISDMDRVMQAEFNKDFQGILQRAIISTTTKAIAQYQMQKESSGSGTSLTAAVMGIYTFATTAADLRVWTAMPKDFQISRLAKPENNVIKISAGASEPIEINLGQCNNAVVYLKMVNSSAVAYEVMRF